ncbi:unnamed protein product [Spirodela intermedia]|uniref:Uncharacterized protein n=1 Tax=Spirodela intermedia TaxID=51605 RepID=A0A7I8JQK8_SPIIN|nr:unnamed protein product [Spirodela intermedia]CAA6672051.1 unnamed protein product [Spirodela intermedia]
MTSHREAFFAGDGNERTGEPTSQDDDITGWFDRVAEKAGFVQAETLRRIIEINRGTEYLRRWLGEDLRLEDLELEELETVYSSLVPLASHADFEPYIQRIVDGDASPILTRDTIATISLRVFPIRAGGRILEFIYGSQRHQTRGGVTVGTATTHFYASEEFKIKQRTTKSFTCSPRETILAGDYKQTTYCHLLLGLVHCDHVEFVTSTFAYSIVQAFAALEELWPEICQDIKTGGLSQVKVTSPNVRRAVLEVVSPDPSLARRIKSTCKELQAVDWQGVVPALWPNAKYIYSIMTGSMLPYLKKLRHYAGSLPLVGADYGSSESWIGVNLEPSNPPERVTFTVIPTLAYFEFIRLYRYKLGDVVEVTSFYKGSPQLSFVCRRKLILTVNIDKSTEKDLQLAVEKASRLLAGARSELIDFTSHAIVGDGAQKRGHYVVYWEVKGRRTKMCCRSDVAPSDRWSSGWWRGHLQEDTGLLCRQWGNLGQFKTPRCTSNQVLLLILDRRTRRQFWSTAYEP